MMNTSVRKWLAPLGLFAAFGSLAALTQCDRGGGDTIQASERDRARPARTTDLAQSEQKPLPEPAATVAPSKANVEPAPDGPSAETDIQRLTLSHAVEDREPVPVERIQGGRPVFAFFEAKNTSQQSRTVQVVFEHAEGTRVGFVKLEIPANSSRWRTWAKTERVHEAGAWTAIVMDAEGNQLARTAFSVSDAVPDVAPAGAEPEVEQQAAEPALEPSPAKAMVGSEAPSAS